MERAADPDVKFDIVTFDLATGAKVRAVIDEFWEQLSDDDLRHRQQPRLYFAIRVYADEATNPKRLVSHTEFRAGNDFDQSCIPRLWTWLGDLSVSRHRFSYDCVEDFLEEFSARMDEFTAAAEDVADYLHKAHGIQPTYEDPPHAEFSEDQSMPTKEEKSVVEVDAESLNDDFIEGQDTHLTNDQDEEISDDAQTKS
jgi:hypothetical protein